MRLSHPMSRTDEPSPARHSAVATELVTLFSSLGFAVVIRNPVTADVVAASERAETVHLAAAPGTVRIAAARVAGENVRVELVRSTDSELLDLTPRQVAVARLLASGLPNKEIGEQLRISTHTVRRHLEAVYRRLKVRNRAAAITALQSVALPAQEVPDGQ